MSERKDKSKSLIDTDNSTYSNKYPWPSYLYYIYTISECVGPLEIPYVLTWAFNKIYTAHYRESMQPNTVCSSNRCASQVKCSAEMSGTEFGWYIPHVW